MGIFLFIIFHFCVVCQEQGKATWLDVKCDKLIKVFDGGVIQSKSGEFLCDSGKNMLIVRWWFCERKWLFKLKCKSLAFIPEGYWSSVSVSFLFQETQIGDSIQDEMIWITANEDGEVSVICLDSGKYYFTKWGGGNYLEKIYFNIEGKGGVYILDMCGELIKTHIDYLKVEH